MAWEVLPFNIDPMSRRIGLSGRHADWSNCGRHVAAIRLSSFQVLDAHANFELCFQFDSFQKPSFNLVRRQFRIWKILTYSKCPSKYRPTWVHFNVHIQQIGQHDWGNDDGFYWLLTRWAGVLFVQSLEKTEFTENMTAGIRSELIAYEDNTHFVSSGWHLVQISNRFSHSVHYP